MIKKYIILLTILPLILCGCWDQRLFEQTGFITILGIESSSQGDMNLTYVMPIVDPSAQSRVEILDTTAELLRAGRDKLRRESSKNMEAGKIQLLVYSKELAEKGMIQNINSIFERDPTNPILAWVTVTDGSPRNLIHGAEKFKDKPLLSTYITQLLERAVKTASITETRIFRYDIDSGSPGIDAIAPLIKLTSNSIQVQGSALFSSGKMVGAITPKQNGLLVAMMSTLKDKQYPYIASSLNDDSQNPKHGMSILVRQSSKKINISINNNIPVVDIYLDLYGYIDECNIDNLNDEKEVGKISNHVQDEIQADCQQLITYLQEIKSDPIGIGDMIRATHNNYWKRIDWHEAYKDAIITTHVKFNVIQYGAIE